MRKVSFGQHKKNQIISVVTEKARINKISRLIPDNLTVLDLGCGYNANLLQSIQKRSKKIYGLDLVVNKNLKGINLIQGRVDRGIPLPSKSIDLVTAMAIIEHVDDPLNMLIEARRVLINGGKMLITTPSLRAKPLLEFSARVGLDNIEEISDHKRYYTPDTLKIELLKAGFTKVNTFGFSLFKLNILGIAIK